MTNVLTLMLNNKLPVDLMNMLILEKADFRKNPLDKLSSKSYLENMGNRVKSRKDKSFSKVKQASVSKTTKII